MVFITSPKSPYNINPVLSTLKTALKENSTLLKSLEIHKISFHRLHDQPRIYEKSITQFKIEVGTYYYQGRHLPISAYLYGEDKVPSRLFIAYYVFPFHGMGTRINIADLLKRAIIDKHYRVTGSYYDMNVMLKLYFILQGIAHEGPITFDRYFVQSVIRICKEMASSQAPSTESQEQPYQPHTSNPPLKIEQSETAHEHEELPIPLTTTLKQEPDNRPGFSAPANENAVRISNPEATPPGPTVTHPTVQSLPLRPSPLGNPRPSPPKPKINATQLEQHFTAPMEAAQSEEKALDKKLLTTKQKLDRHQEDIEALWAKIAEADKKKLKLESKMQDYERRKEQAQKTQKDLVDRLDPGLKSFIKVARELDIEGEERDAKRVKRG